ncbi:oxidoreductase [Streptomyces mashuensis]|uniref:Oxidoreductase n=1 Tax=Streptomyces mashuensis TaxID=33904 RepID=A0A919EEC2_9ACTN|nr:NADP-dependent oxidoreductase [Streptomyces mashuensis]GHF55338.1 oxidoreductase [Streptomyces mashuensis]
MARAVLFHEPGGPEVLRLEEIGEPQPGPGQVRVRVRAAGVQPYDVAIRAGWTPPGAGPLPRIPGNEIAGVVDQVGPDVTAWAPGDEVLGFGQLGGYAELAIWPADQLARKPAAMPWEVAGGFTAGMQTAHIALGELAPGPGEVLLVHGAAGSVGTAAVQLARAAGATVIGTAREENHAHLAALGALPVAYGEGLRERIEALAPDGVDAVLDGAGGAAFDLSLRLGVARDRILTLVEHDRAAEAGVRVTPPTRSAARLAGLAERYARGELTWHVRATYPLERAADAQRDVETGHGRGKVVLLMGE